MYFVDYGITESINFSMIKKIDPDFLQLPAQAIHCQLFGTKKTWTKNESNLLYNQLQGKQLKIEFVSRNDNTFQVLIRNILYDDESRNSSPSLMGSDYSSWDEDGDETDNVSIT